MKEEKKTSEHEVMFMRLAYGRSKKLHNLMLRRLQVFHQIYKSELERQVKNIFDMLCNSHAIDMKSKQQSPQQCVRGCS